MGGARQLAGAMAGLALCALAAGCGGSGKNDVRSFDDARLERLASAGDTAAIAERRRRADAAEAKAAEDKAKAEAAAAKTQAGVDEAGKRAFDQALAANDETAIEKLAETGVPAALYHRGEKRVKSGDQGLAQLGYDDIEAAADKGDPDALLWVGFRRAQGIEGYPWNPASGRDMIERAANMGSVDAMYAAGQFYEYAGPLQDIAKAKDWYAKAADKGSDAARSRLAEIKAAEAEGTSAH